MNAVLRRRLERAARVRDFIRAHKTDGAGEGTALARLEELLQRAEALAAQQRAGVVATRSAALQRRELRHALQTKLLKYLAAVGAVAAKGNAELAPQFRLPPTGASHQVFLTAARGMLKKASAQKELLVSRGVMDQARWVARSLPRLPLATASPRTSSRSARSLAPGASRASTGR